MDKETKQKIYNSLKEILNDFNNGIKQSEVDGEIDTSTPAGQYLLYQIHKAKDVISSDEVTWKALYGEYSNLPRDFFNPKEFSNNLESLLDKLKP